MRWLVVISVSLFTALSQLSSVAGQTIEESYKDSAVSSDSLKKVTELHKKCVEAGSEPTDESCQAEENLKARLVAQCRKDTSQKLDFAACTIRP